MSIPALEIRDLTIAYGGSVIIDALSMEACDGEAIAVLGPSGSGKTTLLYAIAGFVPPHHGEIRMGGRVVADENRSDPPERRSVGFVFQNYALWPHLSAIQIVSYPLRRAGAAAEQARREAAALLELVGIGDLADRSPSQLSGGQQQRVGLARALARRPSLYLLDEPTAHLDSDLRSALQEELVARRRAEGATALYATHDAAEALAVADRVVILRDGRIVQIGTPGEIYDRPVDLWAARLAGAAWAVDAVVVGRSGDQLALDVGGAGVVVPFGRGSPGERVRLVVRPDWVVPGEGVEGTVVGAFYRGPHTDYRLATPAGAMEMRRPGPSQWRTGDRVGIRIERGWPVAAD